MLSALDIAGTVELSCGKASRYKAGMSSLAALMNYVDAQKAPLDWPAFLRSLADEYRATTGLFYHEFGGLQKGALLDTVGVSDEYIEVYKRYATKNPWLNFLWRDPTGAFIFGEKLNPLSRSRVRFTVFHSRWLKPQNLVRGIGAVLFKDKDIVPGWGVMITLLRPDGEPGIGRYSEEERERFQSLIPFMLRHIRQHPFVENRISPDKIATIRYINPAKTGDDVPKPDDRHNDIGAFLDRLAITELSRRDVVTRVIEAGQRGDDALLGEVRRTLENVPATAAATPEAGPFAQRVGRSRAPANGESAATPPIPSTWKEATLYVPGLLKWEEAKAAAQTAKQEGRRTGRFSIIDHLKDVEHGYGRWTLQEPGLPRTALLAIGDNGSHEALTSWLSREGNALPPGLHVPTNKQWTDILASQASSRRELPYHVAMALDKRNRRASMEK